MKLFQKILSHGLLIAFFVAAFFLYLYRVELFPEWFGEDVQPVAARSGTGIADRTDNLQTAPAQREAAPEASVGAESTAAEGLTPSATEESPSLTTQAEAPPGSVSSAGPGVGQVADRPPMAGTATHAEKQGTGSPGPTGASELPPMAVASDASDARPQGPAAGPELPPVAGSADRPGRAAQPESAAAPELPPVTRTPGQKAGHEPPEPTAAPELPPLVEDSDEPEAQTQPESAAAGDLPPLAGGSTEQATGQTPEGQPALVELPPAAGASGEAQRPDESRTEAGGAAAPGGAPERGEEVAAGMPGTTPSVSTATPSYRDASSREPAITWETPREPLPRKYPPLHQPRRSAAGWPAPGEEAETGPAKATESATAAPQYRPKTPLRSPAEEPSGAPAAAANSAGGSDYEQRLDEARQRFWAQDLGAAVSAYENLTLAYPDRADAWGELGNVNFRLGRWSEAADAYYTAIGLLADEGEVTRARHLLKILRGLDADKASELEGRLR